MDILFAGRLSQQIEYDINNKNEIFTIYECRMPTAIQQLTPIDKTTSSIKYSNHC